MKLALSTWPEAAEFAGEAADKVCLIPTGSLEQHGPHLPLFTDSLLVTAFAEELERRLPDKILLLPTLWLGASAHHMGFPGSLTASFTGYHQAVWAALESLFRHGFSKFFILNGHGGNSDSNALVCRQWRQERPSCLIGHCGWYDLGQEEAWEEMKGSVKSIRHACEAETSLMLHLHPDLVRMDKAVDDGLAPDIAIPGAPWAFDEISESGVLGQATLGSAELGSLLFESCVAGAEKMLKGLAEGVVLTG